MGAGLSGCSPAELPLTSSWTPGARILWDAFPQATGRLHLRSDGKARKTRRQRGASPSHNPFTPGGRRAQCKLRSPFPSPPFWRKGDAVPTAEPPPPLPSRAARGARPRESGWDLGWLLLQSQPLKGEGTGQVNWLGLRRPAVGESLCALLPSGRNPLHPGVKAWAQGLGG